MSKPFPELLQADDRVMLFVDGENLAIRYKSLVGISEKADHVVHIPDVFVWSNVIGKFLSRYKVIRRYYFTSAIGDDEYLRGIEDQIRSSDFEFARVYKREKGRTSKRVDISMTCEMLVHGLRDTFDCAIVVTGDEDFVPAVEALTREGKRVVLWHMPTGCSPSLKRSSDHVYDLGPFFLASEGAAWGHMRGDA